MDALVKRGQAGLASSLLTFFVVFGSSVLFCSKAIFVKLAFRYNLDPISVLALRMSLALPFFLLGAWRESRKSVIRITPKEWFQIAGLGFLGWYFSSLVNFEGLRHISVGLERIILYTYPSFILLVSTLWLKQPLRKKVVLGMLVGYTGIVISYYAEANHASSSNIPFGVFMVFLSALSYGTFVMLSERMIQRLGALRFTSWVVAFSGLYGLIHFEVTHSVQTLLHLPKEAYGWGLALAVLGTVMPAYLFGIGLKRTDPQTFAIIGMAGPLGTVFLGYWLLNENLDAIKICGLVMALLGGLWVSLNKSSKPKSERVDKV